MTHPRLAAEFTTADALQSAVDALAREHYRELETYAPCDMPEELVRAVLAARKAGGRA